MATVTEAQKKQIMIALVCFISLLLYISGIRPMQTEIEENKIELQTLKSQREEMESVVNDVSIVNNYKNLRDEYQVKFQERFENFKSNEKIEEITTEQNVSIKSLRINNFTPVNINNYENYVAQPKNEEEYSLVQVDERSPVFPLLLCSEVSISFEVTEEKELQLYDAFNNIAPVAPGINNMDRYCILIPTMELSRSSGGSTKQKNYRVLVFAMETLDLSLWDEEFQTKQSGVGGM